MQVKQVTEQDGAYGPPDPAECRKALASKAWELFGLGTGRQESEMCRTDRP